MASPAALPYKIYYSKLPENHTLTVLEEKRTYSLAGFYVHFDRHIIPFWINIYIPVSLLVIISWLRYLSECGKARSQILRYTPTSFSSFIIPPDLMPGRMALLITILLMLMNMSGRAREDTPSSDTFSMIDLWILLCIIFVTLALLEYGLVIKIRYSNREPTEQVHVLEAGKKNWTRVNRHCTN